MTDGRGMSAGPGRDEPNSLTLLRDSCLFRAAVGSGCESPLRHELVPHGAVTRPSRSRLRCRPRRCRVGLLAVTQICTAPANNEREVAAMSPHTRSHERVGQIAGGRHHRHEWGTLVGESACLGFLRRSDGVSRVSRTAAPLAHPNRYVAYGFGCGNVPTEPPIPVGRFGLCEAAVG